MMNMVKFAQELFGQTKELQQAGIWWPVIDEDKTAETGTDDGLELVGFVQREES